MSSKLSNVACGRFMSMAIKEDGKLDVWGATTHINPSYKTLEQVTKVACCDYQSVVLLGDGTVACYNSENTGEEEEQDEDELEFERERVAMWGERYIAPPTSNNIADIVCGSSHSVALTTEGNVITWGYNWQQQCDPVHTTYRNIVLIAAGFDHSAAVDRNGLVYIWGCNKFEQCDLSHTTWTNVTAISCGFNFTAAVTSNNNGSVVCCGGQKAFDIDYTSFTNIESIDCGMDHVVALTRSGTVHSWATHPLPQPDIDIVDSLTGVVSIACGCYHSMAILDDGTLKIWGQHKNKFNAIYNKYIEEEFPPRCTDIVSVVGGMAHFVAVYKDGSVASFRASNPYHYRTPYGLRIKCNEMDYILK